MKLPGDARGLSPESAAIAILYVLAVGFALRELTPRKILKTLFAGGRFVGLIMIMTSAAAVFGWLLAYYKFPDATVGFFDAFGVSRDGVMLAIIVLYIMLGMVIESIPAIIMFLPVIQALGDSVGIHPVQLGCVVILTTALGLVTPPHGVCLLVASKILGVHPRSAIPMTLLVGMVGLTVILLAGFVPGITLWVPSLVMPDAFALTR